MPDHLLTPSEVIQLLRLADDGADYRTARERLRHRLRTRQIPFVRLGRLIRFRRADIERAIEQAAVPAMSRS
jgi:excisionase family DNA binding protein